MQNPLYLEFKTPFKSAPFSKILPKHFIDAIPKNINDSLKSITSISNQKESPTFNNTIIKLQDSSVLLGRNTSLLFNLNSAETSSELQNIAQKIALKLSNYKNDILLNEKLFERVKYVFLNTDRLKLSSEELTLLDKEFKTFTRNGALLSDEEKQKLREVDELLAVKALAFG